MKQQMNRRTFLAATGGLLTLPQASRLIGQATVGGEIVLAVRDQTGYQSGDILCAFNQKRIGLVHASHICHPKKFGFSSSGLRQPGTLLERMLRRSYQYKFQRVSRTEVERMDLATLDVEIFSDKTRPRAHVEQYVFQRKLHARHLLFGSPGREYWFLGRYRPDVDAIWAEIEEHSPERRVDHQLHPLSERVKRAFLALRLSADFDDQAAADMTAQEVDEEGTVLRKRTHMVDWRALDLGVLARDIEDRSLAIDVRELVSLDRAAVVRQKVAR
jgi:hypothetical protein